jgi:hypothetical protein
MSKIGFPALIGTVVCIIITIGFQIHTQNQIPDEYEIGMEITSTFANATAEQCSNVKCVKTIEKTRDHIITGFGIASALGGVLTFLDFTNRLES